MKIGLLNCYHWDGQANSYQTAYAGFWRAYLEPFLPANWSLRIFEVAQGEFPESTDVCDAWIIGGSGKSSFEKDPWILTLQDWVRQLHAASRKLLGICFGHQIIALSLGGGVERSPKGWGVGVRTFRFNQIPDWYQANTREWMQNAKLIFSHRDQVTHLPDGAVCVASDAFCPIQSFTIENHIFTLQGHPEYTADYARARLVQRESLIGKAVCEKAQQSLAEQPHATEFAQMIVQFLAAA